MTLPFVTDEGMGTRATFGLIVLQTDETIEPELARIMALDGVVLYHNRIPMTHQVTAGSLAAMAADLPGSVRLLPPSAAFNVVAYGCTSASTIIGPEGIERAVQSVLPGVTVTNPISAVIAACRALEARRIGFITPYVADVSAAMRLFLEDHGLAISAFDSFEEGDDRIVARISPASSLAAIQGMATQSDCDVIFVSCTNMRIAGIVEQAERAVGKPVISSNLALGWHMLRLAGVADVLPGLGVLFEKNLVSADD